MRKIGVYIHIPFCVKKCIYCDFVSYAKKENQIKPYIEAVLKEIEHVNFNNYIIDTIYIGGGTPSVIDANDIKKILDKLKKFTKKTAEITIEINPGTITKEKLLTYKEAGINRISIGLQTTSDKLLKEIRKNTYI